MNQKVLDELIKYVSSQTTVEASVIALVGGLFQALNAPNEVTTLVAGNMDKLAKAVEVNTPSK